MEALGRREQAVSPEAAGASVVQHCAHVGSSGTSRQTKAVPIPLARMNVRPPSCTFLSWRMWPISASAASAPPGMLESRVGKPGRCEMTLGARRRLRRGQCSSRADSFMASTQPMADALAMGQAVAVAGRGFQRMAEGMTEIEQRTVARLAFVAGNDRRLHGAAMRHRVAERARVARERSFAVRFQPGEKLGVAEKTVFDDLGIAREKFALREACRARRCRRSPRAADETCRPDSCRARC